MDETLRKLERDFNANSSQEIAEKIVRHKMRLQQLDSLLEVQTKEFSLKKWVELVDSNYDTFQALQLPHGALIRWKGFEKGGLTFVPGIKIV